MKPDALATHAVDDELRTRVRALFATYAAPGSPGAAVAVARHAEVVIAEGYGEADIEHGIPISPDTVFHVASVSKQVVGFAAARLADEGRLDLDADVRQWLPELPDFGATISPRHLLLHTSGLRDQWELLVMAGWRMEDVITTADVLAVATAQRELNFAPGSEYVYCNTGYTLLAELVERVTGQSLRVWCQERIFGPLGMTRTHWHTDHREVVFGSAQSYAPRPTGGFQRAILSFATVGATGLWTNANDLLKWAANVRRGDVGGSHVRELAQRPGQLADGTELAYGFGLSLSRQRGARTIGHSGADAGFRSHLLVFPDHEVDVVVLSNHAACDPAALARRIADVVLGDELDADPAGDTAPPSPELERWVGRYFDARAARVHTVVMDGVRLALDGRPPRVLESVAPGRFYVEAAPEIQVKFEADPTGPILTVVGGGVRVRAVRVDPRATNGVELSRLIGSYWSEELDVRWMIELVDDGTIDGLALRRRTYRSVPLEPIAPATFGAVLDRWSAIDVVIEFPSYGEFLATTDRVRRVRFRKDTRFD